MNWDSTFSDSKRWNSYTQAYPARGIAGGDQSMRALIDEISCSEKCPSLHGDRGWHHLEYRGWRQFRVPLSNVGVCSRLLAFIRFRARHCNLH